MDDDDGWMELDVETAAELAGEAPPATVAVALLDGRELEGPFHRVQAGGPLVEVWEAEVDSSTGRPRMRRVGLVGRVPHTAGPDDLLRSFGPGVWICQVRGARGQILGTQWVATGTRAQRERAALATAQRVENPPTDEAPVWLQKLLERQAVESEGLRRELAELRDAERRRAADDQRRLAAELEELRTELKRSRPAPAADVDPVAAVKRRLQEARELQEILGVTDDAPDPDPDFLEEAGDTLAGLLGKYGKAAGIMDMLGSGE